MSSSLQPDRQNGFVLTGKDEPEAVKRINAIFRRWLNGERLSRDQRDEVALVVPEAVAITVEASPLPARPGALTEEEILALYEISRAKYFRWKKEGLAVPENPDPPPFDAPEQMVSWYERMKARGIFKHRCPKKMLALARGASSPPGIPSPGAPSPRPVLRSQPETSAPAHSSAPDRRGFLVELEELECHAAEIREKYQDAYLREDRSAGDLLKAEYFEIIELLRKYTKDKEAIGVAEGELIKKADVQQDLAAIVPAIFGNLLQLALPLYAEIKTTLAFSEFADIWRQRLTRAFDSIEKSNFAPPLSLHS